MIRVSQFLEKLSNKKTSKTQNGNIYVILLSRDGYKVKVN